MAQRQGYIVEIAPTELTIQTFTRTEVAAWRAGKYGGTLRESQAIALLTRAREKIRRRGGAAFQCIVYCDEVS